MTITAQSIVKSVLVTLNDLAAVRWPVGEVVGYLNDGQREIVTHRPDATSTRASIALVAGSRQSLPATAAKLIDVHHNTASPKDAVTFTTRELLDAIEPGWQGMTGSKVIEHVIYDVREPRSFYTYPPAAASGASIEALYSLLPTNIAIPADGAPYTDVAGNISLGDLFANALQDYMLYRAYLKQVETSAGMAQLALAKYNAYANALGIELKATVAVASKEVNRPTKAQS